MAGLYIHIPFCRKACHYCNFHFSTQLSGRKEMVEAICSEIALQKDFFGNRTKVSSIYFGGGTPSVLGTGELEMIFNTLSKYFTIEENAEITLEANPDDLAADYISDLKKYTAVNRLSIGVQSLDDGVLTWMNRTHSAEQSRQSIEDALKHFNNISADLIYGLPAQFGDSWRITLDTLLQYRLPHISAYALTVEPRTALEHQVKKGLTSVSESANNEFMDLTATVRSAGYRHYEISNIALPGFEAKHNSSYWQGKPYLGIGPSAHSFRGIERSWNVANNLKYLRSISAGVLPAETEVLSFPDRYNEYVMTGLRLEEGINASKIEQLFGTELADHFAMQLSIIDKEYYHKQGENFSLTDTGRLWCDKISASLFYTT